MIISFLNQKGGVGKTTLSINVAGYLANQGHKVLLIDADKQASSSTWASLREEPTFQVVNLARSNMAKEAIAMAADYDHTIIDGPPHAEEIARSCIIASDYVVLPDRTVRSLHLGHGSDPCGKSRKPAISSRIWNVG